MIMTKTACKDAMALDAQLAAKLCYKAEMVRNLTDRIEGLEQFATHYIGSLAKARELKRTIMIEMLQVLGALAGEYKKAYDQNLFNEYVDYRNYTKLTGEARVKTVGQMCEILKTADECCREVWADYLTAEGDTYMTEAK